MSETGAVYRASEKKSDAERSADGPRERDPSERTLDEIIEFYARPSATGNRGSQ